MSDAATYLSLSAAAFGAGVVNSLAGGGTLLTFPSLVAALSGRPDAEQVANVTSTIALVPGSLAGAWGYRRELGENRRWLRLLAPASLFGGLVGGFLLIKLPAVYFAYVVPWLLLTASLLFIAQPYISKMIHPGEDALPAPALQAVVTVFQFFVAIYGGYFGAGIGILMLSSLGLMGIGDVHRLNAIKTLLAVFINGVSAIVFIVDGKVIWTYALIMAVAAILGGYFGASYGRRLPRSVVRWFVIVVGLVLTVHYFRKQYFLS